MAGPIIPEAAHETFANPPLKAMFGQLRFPTNLKVADLPTLAKFQEAIGSRLSEFAEEQHLSVTISPGAVPQQATGKSYRFSTQDGHWSAVLAPDALTLEAAAGGRYTSYDQFREIFQLCWGALLDHLPPPRIVHQGLRYIDHLEGDRPGPAWSEYINPELLGSIAGEHLSQGLFHSLTEMRFQREDGVVVFRHGLTQAGPENISGYLLDFDYFTQEHSEDIGTRSLLDRFDSFHDLLYSFFRWCVTEKAVKEFREAAD